MSPSLHRSPAPHGSAKLATVRNLVATGSATVSGIARDTGLSRQAVLRIKAGPAAAEAALVRWGA